MSYLEAEGLSKSELKTRLTQMGMSLDKDDHPKDYYMQLYLDKYNAKNKVTRDNTPFYKEEMLRGKREREKSYEAQNNDEIEYPEEDEANNYGDDDDEDYVYEESEESKENSEKKIRRRKRKAKTIKVDDYRESGIKVTRLIRSKKKRILKNKAREGNEQNNVKKNIFVVSTYDQKAGQNNEYNTYNYNNNYKNENNQGLYKSNGYQFMNKNNEYNVYSNNNLPEEKRKMITLKVEKMFCDGDVHYNKRNQYKNETEPINDNRNENQYYGVEVRENYNQNLSPNINNPSNSKNNSNNYYNAQYGNSSGNGKQKYNFFIRNITKTVKDDLKKNQMSSKPKNILVNSDNMNQIEGNNEYNNNNNLRSSPYQDDLDMNNPEVVVYPRILKGKNKEIQDQQLRTSLPKDQIVSESIKETKIMDQYNNNQAGNIGEDNNYDNNNEYRQKLRSYSKNKGSNLPDSNNDNNNYNQNNDTNYFNEQINSSNQKYDNDNNNNNYDKFNNIGNREQYMNNYKNMGNIRNSNKFNDNSNNRSNLNEFNSENYNSHNNINDANGIYESNPNNNILRYSNQHSFKEDHGANYPNNYNNQNDLNQYGENLEQKIKYNNNENNNSFLNSTVYNSNNMNDNNNNQFSSVGNDNNMNYNYDNGDYESTLSDNQSKFSFWKSGRNLKNKIMEKFKKNIYLFPLILLIVFGIAYFFTEEDHRSTILISFTIIMGLIVLYLLFKYIMEIQRYKKMATEDREELLNELQSRNISVLNLIDNTALLNNFIENRIQHHNISQDEYINYVFPYLQKFLKKDELELSKDKEENPISYWIEI